VSALQLCGAGGCGAECNHGECDGECDANDDFECAGVIGCVGVVLWCGFGWGGGNGSAAVGGWLSLA